MSESSFDISSPFQPNIMNHTCFKHNLAKTNNGCGIFYLIAGKCYKVEFNNIVLVHGYDSYVLFFKNVENCHYSVKKRKR